MGRIAAWLGKVENQKNLARFTGAVRATRLWGVGSKSRRGNHCQPDLQRMMSNWYHLASAVVQRRCLCGWVHDVSLRLRKPASSKGRHLGKRILTAADSLWQQPGEERELHHEAAGTASLCLYFGTMLLSIVSHLCMYTHTHTHAHVYVRCISAQNIILCICMIACIILAFCTKRALTQA